MYKEYNPFKSWHKEQTSPEKPFLIQDSITTIQNDGIPYFYKEWD